ncbi:MAG: TonB-dependent receptor [Alphaproteobacteria bacterium]
MPIRHTKSLCTIAIGSALIAPTAMAHVSGFDAGTPVSQIQNGQVMLPDGSDAPLMTRSECEASRSADENCAAGFDLFLRTSSPLAAGATVTYQVETTNGQRTGTATVAGNGSLVGVLDAATAGIQTRVESLTVTARKVVESAQTVPIAISAATGQNLIDYGFTEVQDIAKLAPSLSIRPGSVTGSGFADISLRGQSGTFLTLNADQAVGLYVNGAPVSRSTGYFTTLFDIERIEVLKGPQGTLYGRNTTGGAINIFTNAPNFGGINGYGEITAGNFDRLDFQGAINLPIISDKVAVRLAGARTKRDGFGVGNVNGQDLANDDEVFFRGSLLIEPNENLSIRINGDYHKADEAGGIFRSLRSVSLFGGALPLAVESVGDIYIGNAYGAEDINDLEEFTVNGTITLDLDGVTLTSITAYREHDTLIENQTGPVVDVLLRQKANLFSQELRAQGTAFGDRLVWQVGGFYSDESGFDVDQVVALGTNQITDAKNESWAIFTQNTFSITEDLRFTAGARFTREKKFVEEIALDARNTETFNGWSWTFGIDYQITENIFAYVSVARGFRSGAVDQDNITNIVQPEFVTNYEVGLKGDYFDQRLRVNLAGYYSDYEDIQRTGFLPDSILTGITNAAQAKITGFEADVTAIPIDGLTLTAGIAYLDARYKEYFVGPLDRTNDSFGLPEWTVTLTARYEIPIGNDGIIGLQASYYWQDETDYTNATVVDLLPRELRVIESYGLLNLQIDYDVQRWGGFNIAFYARNVTDEEYFTAAFVSAVFGQAFSNRIVGEPRTWGFRLRKNF